MSISFDRDPAMQVEPSVRGYQPLPVVDAIEQCMVDGPITNALSVHTQTVGDTAPGIVMSVQTGEGVVRGRTYKIGDASYFIGLQTQSAPQDGVEDPSLDLGRSMQAMESGKWFEHVYPYGISDPAEIAAMLQPLADFANKNSVFFVAACIDGACVVMPARMDSKFWENGPSKRYGDYMNATDGNGELATQAMILIDPGSKRYANSEQIGVRDANVPPGQLAIDVDSTGYYVEQMQRGFRQDGTPAVVAKTVADALSWGYGLDGNAQTVVRALQ